MTPYYERAGVRLFHGDARDVLPTLTERGVVIFDPPYSEHVHGKSRKAATGHDRKRGIGPSISNDFGFAHLSPMVRRALARHAARLAARWVLVFSDTESAWLWRLSLTASGLEHVRDAAWIKPDGTPQFTGDRPAIGLESITIAHPKGRKRWNGGGKRGVYDVPIVRELVRAAEPRLHTTQKPEALMLALVADFSDPGEIVYDFTMGSGTTGIGCLRAPGGPRRFVGIEREERWIEAAAKRLDAELSGSTYHAAAKGQQALFATVRS